MGVSFAARMVTWNTASRLLYTLILFSLARESMEYNFFYYIFIPFEKFSIIASRYLEAYLYYNYRTIVD